MLKDLLKKGIYTLATAAVLGSSVNAQTIYWGAGHTNTAIDSIGSFTDLNASNNYRGWTLNANASHTQATWSYSTTGISSATLTTSWANNGWAAPIASPTASTGAMLYDSDGISVAINNTNIATGAHLVSPAIDLSAAAGNYIIFQFYANFLEFNTDSFYLDLSLDGGNTFSYQFDIHNYSALSDVRSNYNGIVRIPMLTALPSDATTLTDCRIRIRYKGILYFYAIDDISIIAAPQKDIAIGRPVPGTSSANSFQVAVMSNNLNMPLSQVTETDTLQFQYGVKVDDNSSIQVTAADGPFLDILIEYNNAGTWATEHSERIAITQDLSTDTLVTGNLVGNWRPDKVGQYRTTYTIGLENATDAFEDNNSHSHTFNITENYFSKVPRIASGTRQGLPASTQGVYPASTGTNKIAAFEYGSLYFFPNKNDNKTYKVDSVAYTARFMVSSSMSPNYNKNISLAIKKFVDTNGDSRPNAATELQLVGLVRDSILAVPSATTQQEFSQVTANVIDVITEEAVVLESDEFYWVGFVLENNSGLTDANGLYTSPFPGGYNLQTTRNLNYGINTAINIAVPSPVRIREVTSTGGEVRDEWNWIGFGTDLIPSVGLFISENGIAVNQVEAANNFNIFPNPTSDVLQVALALENATHAKVIMTDVTGRVVRLEMLDNVQNETLTFDVNNLSAGVYFISVKTDKGVSTQRFVKK